MSSFNPLDETQMRTLKAEVAQIASALSDRSIPLLEGVRRLNSLGVNIFNQTDDPDFIIFTAIDSETVHLPSQSMRSLCSPAWLEKCDAELAELEKFYGSEINVACARLIARFTVGH